jgi:FkbM family methyltransferase
MRILNGLKNKAWFRKSKRFIKQIAGQDVWYSPQIKANTIRHGDWCFIPDNLTSESIIYSLGVGEDIIFDVEIIKEFNVSVEAFDPTPNSIKWLENTATPDNFNFHPFGISNQDGDLKLYPLVIKGKKSSTMFTLDNECSSDESEFVEIPVKRLSTIMTELKHQKIDILKMDIEGAEYDVIDDLLQSNLDVKQLLVEFHHRFETIGRKKSEDIIKKLNNSGYKIFFISEKGREYSFIKT